MKVLIIATNREKFPYGVAPVGAASIVTTLRGAGHDTDFLDLYFERNVPRAIKKAIARSKPDVVGFSIRNLDNSSWLGTHAYVDDAREIVREVRKHSDATLIAGGSAVSIGYVDMLRYLDVPYGLVGEGEKSVVMLLRALEGHGTFEAIPGLIRLDGEHALVNPHTMDIDLDALPLNDHTPIDYGRYFKAGGYVGIQTKRGCPFECIFCNYPVLEGTKYRLRPPEQCVNDMEKVVRDKGHRDFFFVDGVFNLPVWHGRAIAEEIVRRDLKVRWMAYCNPLGFTRDLARLFKKSGCVGIELGVDSATDKMIEGMKKCFKPATLRKTYDALSHADLPFAVFMLYGGPGETWEDIQESQRILQDAGKANAVMASLGLRVFPQTTIEKIAREEGVVSDETDLLQPKFYVSEELGPPEEIPDKLNRLACQDPTWATPTDWNSWVIKSIMVLSHRLRMMPSWKRVEDYGKHMRRPPRSPSN